MNSKPLLRQTFLFLALLGFPSLGWAANGAPVGPLAGLKTYETRYYTIRTDIDPDDEREAEIRMTRMAEEYHARTLAFSGQITQRLPFFLFKSAEAYYAAGGPAGSAGAFIPEPGAERLMAIAGDKSDAETWHVVQHEGFHQFAHAVIRGELPIWVNEGIAEYFGEALFTGDSFVTGLVPPARLRSLKAEIEQKQYRVVKDMMLMTHEQWNGQMSIINYDQAWSMVHFLINGDGGKYQKPFVGFMLQIGRGMNWQMAWQQNFGTAVGFEPRWSAYWQAAEDDPTADLYVQSTCLTLNSFLARANQRKQLFGGFDEFLAAATSGALKQPATSDWDWLPPRLLTSATQSGSRKGVHWTLSPPEKAEKFGHIAAELPSGIRLVGSSTLKGSPRAWSVTVDIDDLPAALQKAAALAGEGKKDQARALVQQSLRHSPNSPHAEDAKKFLTETR